MKKIFFFLRSKQFFTEMDLTRLFRMVFIRSERRGNIFQALTLRER